MLTILILFCVSYIAVGDDCEPGFADTCFKAVIADLQYMINFRKMKEENVTNYTVTELCLALDDSLNCTSDIIDSECSEHDGKVVFDSWLMAFRNAYYYVCNGPNHKRITDILHGTSCWSIEDFVLCVQEKAGLTDFRHIMHTEMDDIECTDLRRVMSTCRTDATVGSCREQDSVYGAVDGMIRAFFAGSDCEIIPHSEKVPNVSGRATLSTILGTIFHLMVLFFIL